jgi:hypothetical protein
VGDVQVGGMGAGDAAVLGAALCYALTTARLGVHSRVHDATPLGLRPHRHQGVVPRWNSCESLR